MTFKPDEITFDLDIC